MKAIWRRVADLFEEDAPEEPFYDPVHLGAAVIATLAAIGALFWLLWTLLVFEGGLFLKLRAAASVLLTSKTLGDYGYEASPYAMGVFEGWLGNLAALALSAALLAAMHSLWDRARRRRS